MEINKVYCMDNLELMKQIDDNSIDLIYCDILYNTGKKFDDFDDNLGTTQEAIEWYKPRVREMYRILKNTGQIYLHMDFRLSHYIKVLLDEIFGEKNFINEIIWAYRTGGVSKKYFQRKHDNILRYSKTDNTPAIPTSINRRMYFSPTISFFLPLSDMARRRKCSLSSMAIVVSIREAEYIMTIKADPWSLKRKEQTTAMTSSNLAYLLSAFISLNNRALIILLLLWRSLKVWTRWWHRPWPLLYGVL